MTVSQKIQII